MTHHLLSTEIPHIQHVLDQTLHEAEEKKQNDKIVKVAEQKIKLHQMTQKLQSGLDEVYKLNINDIPLECMQKWIKQIEEKLSTDTDNTNF